MESKPLYIHLYYKFYFYLGIPPFLKIFFFFGVGIETLYVCFEARKIAFHKYAFNITMIM